MNVYPFNKCIINYYSSIKMISDLHVSRLPEVFNSYHIQQPDGTPYPVSNKQQIDKAVKSWLSKPKVKVDNNPITALSQGLHYPPDPNYISKIQEIYHFPKKNKYTILFQNWYVDMSNYPHPNFIEKVHLYMNTIEYPQENIKYFQSTTTKLYNEFLNHTERLFYIIHGYGRPYPEINYSEYRVRNILLQATPTALLVLTHYYQCAPCPTVIGECLSRESCLNIPEYELHLIEELSAITTVKDLHEYLTNKGAHSMIKHHETYYEHPLIEAYLYQKVDPNLRYESGMSIDKIEYLPDWELLKIGKHIHTRRSEMINVVLQNLQSSNNKIK